MNKAMLQQCVIELGKVLDGTHCRTHTGLCNGPIHAALAMGSHEHAFVIGLMHRWTHRSGSVNYPVYVGNFCTVNERVDAARRQYNDATNTAQLYDPETAYGRKRLDLAQYIKERLEAYLCAG